MDRVETDLLTFNTIRKQRGRDMSSSLLSCQGDRCDKNEGNEDRSVIRDARGF